MRHVPMFQQMNERHLPILGECRLGRHLDFGKKQKSSCILATESPFYDYGTLIMGPLAIASTRLDCDCRTQSVKPYLFYKHSSLDSY